MAVLFEIENCKSRSILPPRVHLLRVGYNCRISLKYSNPQLMAVCYLNFMLITQNLNLHVRLPNGGK